MKKLFLLLFLLFFNIYICFAAPNAPVLYNTETGIVTTTNKSLNSNLATNGSSSGQVLTSSGGNVVWSTPSGGSASYTNSICSFSTNAANFCVISNIVLSYNTKYTNGNHRSILIVTFTLSSYLNDSAQARIYADNNLDGISDTFTPDVSLVSSGAVSENRSTTILLNPLATFSLTNLCSGSATCTIINNSTVLFGL